MFHTNRLPKMSFFFFPHQKNLQSEFSVSRFKIKGGKMSKQVLMQYPRTQMRGILTIKMDSAS